MDWRFRIGIVVANSHLIVDHALRVSAQVMKIALALAFGLCSGLLATSQGVHLNEGDSFLIGFNSVDPCSFVEFIQVSRVRVQFGIDLLGAGDSLRLEMFENSLNDTPFASQTYPRGQLLHTLILMGRINGWIIKGWLE